MEKSSIGIITNNLTHNALLLSYAADHDHSIHLMSGGPRQGHQNNISSFFQGNTESAKDVVEFGSRCSILIIEDVEVNTTALRQLQKSGIKVYPQPEVIDLMKNRCVLKKFLEQSGIPVTHTVAISSRQDIEGYSDKLPAYLKRCKRQAEDVVLLQNVTDANRINDDSYLLEEAISVKQEIRVLISRNEAGMVECFDPLWMASDGTQVLMDFRLCPDCINHTEAMEVWHIAMKIVNACNLVGFLAIEMFITETNKVIVNDIKLASYSSSQRSSSVPVFEQEAKRMLRLSADEDTGTGLALSSDLLEPAAVKRNSIYQALKSILFLPDKHLSKARKAKVLDAPVEQHLLKAVMIRHILEANNHQVNAVPEL